MTPLNRIVPPQPPSLDEQIAVVQSMIDGVRVAFTQLTGKDSGEITDADALHEIKCLEATRQALLWLRSAPSPIFDKPPMQGDSFSKN